MTKFFIAIFFFSSLCLPHLALAATKYVPSDQDLRPAPAQVSPNFNGNVNFQAEDAAAPQSSGADQNAANQSINRNQQTNQLVERPSNKVNNVFWWALMVSGSAILLIGAWHWSAKYGKK